MNVLIKICIASLLTIANSSVSVPAEVQNQEVDLHSHYMAIVIDDLGNDMGGTEEIIGFAIPLTVAIMPFLETTEQDAKRAHERGHEVIVHMPMEPKSGKSSWLGPGSLMSHLSDKEVRQRVEDAIDNVPYAVGMNNHMGSKVTSNERIMRIVLEVCKERGLYYLDSKTNDKSVASKIALELGVPYAENNLFLDDVLTTGHINKQMDKAIMLLRERDSTVIIGHVGIGGHKTAASLEQAIPRLQQYGEVVFLSELIKRTLIDPEVL